MSSVQHRTYSGDTPAKPKMKSSTTGFEPFHYNTAGTRGTVSPNGGTLSTKLNADKNGYYLPSYEEFTERLYLQNMFAMKLGLESMQSALALESNPHLSHTRVFVGGTNGKGTVSSCLSNILTAGKNQDGSQRKVGFFSSPHLVDFRERFRINGVPVEKEVVHRIGVEVLRKYSGDSDLWRVNTKNNTNEIGEIDAALASPELANDSSMEPQQSPTSCSSTKASSNATKSAGPILTFFEVCTIMAAKIFEHHGVDIAIYEIGLGGRLDAVNALTPPDLAILTCMGLDHQQFLGDTVEKITHEKAAIFVENGDVVAGLQEYPEAMDVINEVAKGKNCNLMTPYALKHESLASQGYKNYKAQPMYLKHHLDTAIEAGIEVFKCSDTEVVEGLKRMFWPGRLQRVEWRGRKFLLDAAHNRDGIRALVQSVHGENIKNVYFGSMKDKDFKNMVLELEKINSSTSIHACLIKNNRRAADKETYEKLGIFSSIADTRQLLDTLVSTPANNEDDTTLICGSIFLLAEVFELMGLDVGRITV